MTFLQLPDQQDNPEWGGPPSIGFWSSLDLGMHEQALHSPVTEYADYAASAYVLLRPT